ncbi:hypothetical protein TPENAI_60867 [Tenacibaculum litopenaei]|uniref:hypothetical protein n=1 Tax=Tenacibaculum litopenaei TaxID=396016 RepID=UPI00389442C5
MNNELIEQVKEKLAEEHGYDFESEFWTDENIAMLQEVVEATEEAIKDDNFGIHKI